jgi:hypothetical protein
MAPLIELRRAFGEAPCRSTGTCRQVDESLEKIEDKL